MTRIEVEDPPPAAPAQAQYWVTFLDPYEQVGQAEKSITFEDFAVRMEYLFRKLNGIAAQVGVLLWQIMRFKEKLPGR